MIQIQVVIEYFTPPGDDKPTIRLVINKLEREDANDPEREMAQSIEGLHAGIMEMIAKEQGGTFEEIKKTTPTPPVHPVQPLMQDSNGVYRFKSNSIVRYLLDNGPFDMNAIARLQFSDEDQEQFAQLIGYSLGGFGDLSYVSDETYGRAAAQEVHV